MTLGARWRARTKENEHPRPRIMQRGPSGFSVLVEDIYALQTLPGRTPGWLNHWAWTSKRQSVRREAAGLRLCGIFNSSLAFCRDG
mgnify:CR=1 FL=1